jgi:nitrogen fixation/metabolism regulation signal transduction histidine kinase
MKKSRTRLLILSSFQRWFLINFVLYTGLFLAILGIGLFSWFKIVVYEVINVAGLLSETFMSTVNRQAQVGLWMIIGLIVLLLALAAFQSFLFSRRIAGPLYALARHFDQCTEKKELKPLTLRKGDLFFDIVEKFNRLTEEMNSKKK